MKILLLDEHYRSQHLSGGDRALGDIHRSLQDLGHDAVLHGDVGALTQTWDVVMVSRPMLGARVRASARRAADRTVYLGVDLHFRRLEFPDSMPPGQPRPVAVTHALERSCWAAYDISVYPTQQEVDTVRAEGFAARWFPYFRTDLDGTPAQRAAVGRNHPHALRLIFVGGSTHIPNVTGMRWLATHILPKLDNDLLDILIVGDWAPGPAAEIADPRIRFLGPLSPAQLSALMGSSHAAIAPLTAGAGLKSKVIDALACGIPLIATSVAMQGIAEPWTLALPGDTLAQWKSALHQLRASPQSLTSLGAAGLTYVNQHHGKEAFLQATADLLQ